MKIYLCILLLAAFVSPVKANDQAAKASEFDSAYAHVVYFWFKNPESLKDREIFETSIKKFMQDSKYAKTRFVGTAPKAVRDVVDDSYTYSLILSFESVEAQAKYQDEPAHIVFVAECKHLWEKVIVYDSIPLAD